VKDARETARTAEKKLYQSKWLDDTEGTSPERPDWSKVFDLGTEAIASHSKDLWIAAWLIEALARLKGFAGLRDGFRLTRELVERYWGGIHPHPDEDGYATTVAQLTGLNGDESEGALLAPIDRIPITAAGTLAAFSSADHKEAIELDKLDPDKRAQRIEKGAISLEMFDKGVRETSAEFYRELIDDIEQSIDEFFKLGEALEARCGTAPSGYPAAPPSSAIRAALTDVRDRVRSISQAILGALSDSSNGDGAATEVAADGTAGASVRKGMSRDEVFRQLLQVADYFRRTEPHSPVSYALEQAVRWGRMTLPELLAELVSDSSVRDDLYKRMGITAPEERSSE
jgi:type VI secretion system protein ImpA